MNRASLYVCMVALGLGGCSFFSEDVGMEAKKGTDNLPAGLANPASTFCIQSGGTIEIRKGLAGDVGYCHLADGRIVEEWTLFRARDGQLAPAPAARSVSKSAPQKDEDAPDPTISGPTL